MSQQYTGSVLGITPSASDDDFTLDAAAGESGKVRDIMLGGEATSSVAMRTRVARSSGQAGAGTVGNTAKVHPNSQAARIAFNTTYATTQPTLDAGDLLAVGWNAHGGVVRWLAAPGEEFVIIGAALISVRTVVGAGPLTAAVLWEED